MLGAPSPQQAEIDGRQESHPGSVTCTPRLCDVQTGIRPPPIKAKRQKIVAGQLPRTAEQKGCSGSGCTCAEGASVEGAGLVSF